MEKLILLVLQGSASQMEEDELSRWRGESEENERLYQQFARVWALTDGGNELVTPGAVPDVREVIRRAEGSDSVVVSLPSRVRARSDNRRLAARAAAAAALILFGFAIAELRPEPPMSLGFGADEFVTGASETATVGLRDGTVIRLAPDSRLRLTGGAGERQVSLTGRAYFAVAKQEGRPFRIRTAAGDVTVLGTRFDLETEREDLRLVVVEGRVAVSARGREAAVEAGEVSRVVEGTLLPVAQVPDVQSIVEWKGNFLAFQNTPLLDAAREIERQYGVQIEITTSELAERTITTWLSDRSLEEVLRIVCAVAVAECSMSDGVVTVLSAESL